MFVQVESCGFNSTNLRHSDYLASIKTIMGIVWHVLAATGQDTLLLKVAPCDEERVQH